MGRSANPRELLTAEHIHDPRAADAGFHEDDAGWVGGDFADDRGVAAERVGAHGGEDFAGAFPRDDGPRART